MEDGENVRELRGVRTELERLVALRLSGPLSEEDLAAYMTLCAREQQLLRGEKLPSS